MQRVDVAREHLAKLARPRINSEVYRTSRHRVFERNRAGNAEWPQPCQPVREITEALAEKDVGLKQIGCIRAYALRA